MITFLAGPGGGENSGIGVIGDVPHVDIFHFFFETFNKLQHACNDLWKLLNTDIEFDNLEWLLQLVGIEVDLTFTILDAMLGGGLMVILAIGIVQKFLKF